MQKITKEAWDQVHQKACDIANASLMEDAVLVLSHKAAMFEILDELEQRFGLQAAILATRADYQEDIRNKRRLFAEALRLAREQGDLREEAEVLDSLQELENES